MQYNDKGRPYQASVLNYEIKIVKRLVRSERRVCPRNTKMLSWLCVLSASGDLTRKTTTVVNLLRNKVLDNFTYEKSLIIWGMNCQFCFIGSELPKEGRIWVSL